jgi:predicted phage terminase large subunit-like protein
MLDLADRLHPREIIPEDGHLFKGLRDFIDRRMQERGNHHYMNPIWPSKDKTVRAEPLRARLQQGKVFFPDMPLVREVFLQEGASFGADAAGIHDDMVDCAAMGVARIKGLRGKAGPRTDSGPKPPEEFTHEWLLARAHARPRRRKVGEVRVPLRLNGRPR